MTVLYWILVTSIAISMVGRIVFLGAGKTDRVTSRAVVAVDLVFEILLLVAIVTVWRG